MSSYLIGFVKDLLENADAQSREQKRIQLENSYREAGNLVECRLKSQHEQLSTVVSAYAVISQRIKDSRAGIQKVKEDLQSCKELLNCKRDELRKPWLDHICNTRVVELVEKIDAVRDAPDRIQVMIAKKHFGRATNLLLSAEAILPNELKDVKALDAVRTELTLKRKSLFTAVEEELKRQIYVRAADEMFSRFQRSESLRLSSATGRGSGRSWQAGGLYGSVRAFTLDTASLSSSGTAGGGGSSGSGACDPLFRWQEVDLDAQSFEEKDACVPEANRARLLVVLVEAGHRLGRLLQLVQRLQESLTTEVLKVIQRAYNEVVNSAAAFGDYSPLSNISHPRYLVEFVEIICELMVVIVHAHQLVLRKIAALQRDAPNELIDLPSDFNSRYVWSKIQNQLQLILLENLDMGHGTNTGGESGPSVELKSMDINRMELKSIDSLSATFTKRPKKKRTTLPLFSFGASVEGRSFRENRHNIAETPDFHTDHDADSVGSLDLLLCRPSHTNIQAIYVPLFDFLKTIEREMSTEQCQLRRFVVEFIETKYLKEVQDNLLNRIRMTPVDFLGVVDQKTQKDLGLNRPILQCALTMNNCLLEIKGLATSLPDYTSQCMEIAFAVLDTYKDIVRKYQDSVLKRESLSKQWSEDKDMVRFLKSYPSYRRMMAALASEVCPRDGEEPAYSEEESRQRPAQENERILSMLESEWAPLLSAKAATDSGEMLHEADSLQRMAHHHESLSWLCTQLTQLHGWLVGRPEEHQRVDERAARRLLLVIEAFRERSDAALIMIRLECRVRAFFFYRHNPQKASYWGVRVDDKDNDEYVATYLQDLSNVGNKLTTALQYHKTRYIFDGLGHFISILLINTLEHIQRVNDNGIKKMSRNIFSLHQVLVTLTNGHESELLRTKQIYESLMTPPETLLTGIMEHGVKYELAIYSQIFDIYKRSHPTKDQRKFVEYQKRLQDYFRMAHV